MLSGGKDSFDACRGISGGDAEYCRWLARQCEEQKKSQEAKDPGAQADQYRLITCGGEKLDISSYSNCIGMAQLYAYHSSNCPKVWGLIPLTYENTDEVLKEHLAAVVLANPDSLELDEYVSGLRKAYSDYKFFFVDNTTLGAHAALFTLKVPDKEAEKMISEGFVSPLLFEDGVYKGEAQPDLVPVTQEPPPLTEADKDELPRQSRVLGPKGFLKLSQKNIEQVKQEITRGAYPVMVVVGEESCRDCREFKADLLEAQKSGKWEYYRYVYLSRGFTIHYLLPLLRQLNIREHFNRYRRIPQAYVFRGKLKTQVPIGAMSSYMDSLRKRVRVIAEEARKAAGKAEKVTEEPGIVKSPEVFKQQAKQAKAEREKAEEKKTKKVIERNKIVIVERKGKAKKPIEGPTDFMELNWKTVGEVKDAIKKGKYPVMLIIGSEHPASRHLKESLFKLQQSGQWEYHRLIFINFHVEGTRRLLKQVGLSYRRVKKLDLFPQIYIFKGKLQPKVPRGGFSADYMEFQRRHYLMMARKIRGAKGVAKGPLGHLRLTPKNFNNVKSDILTSAYPFMVVVGNAESPTDKFWKNLLKLQQGDKWEYHRLIFINFYTETAKDLMQKLGIYDHVKKVGFFPQMYVFRGKLSPEEPEGGFTKAHMRSLKRELVKMAEEHHKSGGAKKND